MKARLQETVHDRANTLDIRFPQTGNRNGLFSSENTLVSVVIEADGRQSVPSNITATWSKSDLNFSQQHEPQYSRTA